MSLADVLATVAIVVSIGTAYATLYFQYLQRRRVAVALGDHIYLCYGPADGKGGYRSLGINVSVSLINAGATDALVTVMSGTIRDSSRDSEIDFRWDSFIDSVSAGTPGKSSSPSWTFKGWVQPLAATSRHVVTQWIQFSSTDPLQAGLVTGTYDFQFSVTEIRPKGGRAHEATTDDADRRQLAVWNGTFTIDDWSSEFLTQHCVGIDDWAPDTCPIALTRRQPGVRSELAIPV